MHRALLLAPVLVAVVIACGSGTSGDRATVAHRATPADAAPKVRRWRVFDDKLEILEISSQPGPIISTAPPPPDMKPVMHPFLSATALDAGHEDQLHTLLVASHSLDEFLHALTSAGFRVDEQK